MKKSLAKLWNEKQELKEEDQELKKQQIQMTTDFNTILSNFTNAIGRCTQLMEERLPKLENSHEGQWARDRIRELQQDYIAHKEKGILRMIIFRSGQLFSEDRR